MSETPNGQSDRGDPLLAAEVPEGADDCVIDVVISYPLPKGRFKAHIRSANLLLANLRAWKAEGRSDIWLSWGDTALNARARLEAALATAAITYTTPPNAPAPPSRAAVLIPALGGVVGVVALGFLLSQKLNDAGEGLRKAAEEQRERDEQMRNSIGRTLDDMRSRTFRELGDPNPSVRLQAITRIGELYTSDPQAVPALVKRITDGDRRVRVLAILVLSKSGTKSEDAVQALRDCLTDGDENIRNAARSALAKLGGLPPTDAPAPAPRAKQNQ